MSRLLSLRDNSKDTLKVFQSGIDLGIGRTAFLDLEGGRFEATYIDLASKQVLPMLTTDEIEVYEDDPCHIAELLGDCWSNDYGVKFPREEVMTIDDEEDEDEDALTMEGAITMSHDQSDERINLRLSVHCFVNGVKKRVPFDSFFDLWIYIEACIDPNRFVYTQ